MTDRAPDAEPATNDCRGQSLATASCSSLPGSKVRHIKPPFKGQRGRCAWCGTTQLPKGRQSWCSQKCVDEYLSRSSPEHIRRMIHQRDKGICALCGCDADAEYRAWSAARKEISRMAERLIHAARWNMHEVHGRMQNRDASFPTAKETKPFRAYLGENTPPASGPLAVLPAGMRTTSCQWWKVAANAT